MGSHTYGLTVSAVGVFVGNAGGKPAYTAAVDYFFNTLEPIVPEDGLACLPGESFDLTTTVSGTGTVLRAPDQASYGCGESVSLTAQPGAGAEFMGWGGALSGTTNPVGLTIEADTTVTADFSVDVTPPVITNVAVTAGETSATLTWDTDEAATSTVDYGESTAYELGPVQSTVPVTAHGVTLVGLTPATTYHYQVTVADAAGNLSSTSDATFTTTEGGSGRAPPDIDIWYDSNQNFGNPGIPQRWINVFGNVSDSDGISSLTYSLNGGPDNELSIGPDNRRLAEAGDFNVEIDHLDLNTGSNNIVITATDTQGDISIAAVDANFNGTVEWPTPYSIDWDSVNDIQEVVQVVDGDWTLVPGGIRTVQVDYDRLLTIGDVVWEDYEITVPVTINAVEATTGPHSGAPGVGIILRWSGHTDSPVVCSQPHCGWLPSGPIGWWRANKLTLDNSKGFQRHTTGWRALHMEDACANNGLQ